MVGWSRHKSMDNIISMLCSDEIIKDEWIKKRDKMIEDLEG